jgi:hypothetical protein
MELSLAGNNKLFPARESVGLVASQLGTGKSRTFCYSVRPQKRVVLALKINLEYM